MKKYLKDYMFLFLIAGIIILLDQWTKGIVRDNLQYAENWMPWDSLKPYVRIVHWRNTGAAFGMFQSLGGVFTILAIVVSIAIVYYFPQIPRTDRLLRLALAMQLGGAIGNLIDRLTIGSVTDFVSILNLPVFNVADLSISTGVVVLVIGMWLKEMKGPDLDSSGTPVIEHRSDEPFSQEKFHGE